MGGRYFVFIDETGNNTQEQFLGIGCLLVPVEHIGAYHEHLKVKSSQIITAVKEKERELQSVLTSDDLVNFLKGRQGPYEMKFKSINATTVERYEWLVSQYFRFPEVHFCCLVIDKHQYPIPTGMDYFDAYMHQLSMLIRNNVGDAEFVVLPDDITVPNGKEYEGTLMSHLSRYGKNCFGVHRLESHSDLFLQMVDVLIGAVVYDFKGVAHEQKARVSQKIAAKLGRSTLAEKFTVSAPAAPNYFSVWPYERK